MHGFRHTCDRARQRERQRLRAHEAPRARVDGDLAALRRWRRDTEPRGVQALRNFADIDEFTSVVYAKPEYIDTLATSTPASAHVKVDYQLQGCPIDRGQLLDTLAALLVGRKPRLPAKTVCTECKLRGVTCVVVAEGIPCLGPVTHAGCGALCPSFHRGCYGCFGPAATPNTAALIPVLRRDGMTTDGVDRVFSTFNVTRFTAERNDR